MGADGSGSSMSAFELWELIGAVGLIALLLILVRYHKNPTYLMGTATLINLAVLWIIFW